MIENAAPVRQLLNVTEGIVTFASARDQNWEGLPDSRGHGSDKMGGEYQISGKVAGQPRDRADGARSIATHPHDHAGSESEMVNVSIDNH